MKNFKKLHIWQKGIAIAIKSLHFSRTMPADQKFGLSGQINRAAISIPSNIAEGSSRSSEKEYCRFIEIALGSAFELETQLLITESANFGSADLRNELFFDLDKEQKMLMGFKRILTGKDQSKDSK